MNLIIITFSGFENNIKNSYVIKLFINKCRGTYCATFIAFTNIFALINFFEF